MSINNVFKVHVDHRNIKTVEVVNWDVFLYILSGKVMSKEFSSPGVYMLNNFYIGKSDNIRSRIKQHIIRSLKGNHYNMDLQERIVRCITLQSLPFDIISRDPNDEIGLISKYKSLGYPLVNKPAIYERY